MIHQPFNIELLNAKTIIIEPTSPFNKEWLDKFHLKKVEFSIDNKIEIGDKIDLTFTNTVSPYSSYYRVNYIYKEDKFKLRINEFEDNMSSTYILPLLGIKKEHLLIRTNFINCYVKHFDFNHILGEYVYLIYRYIPINYYAKFIEILQKQKGCISYLKDQDKRFDCFVFKTNEEFINDVKLLLKGKYSKISDKAKKLILNFHNQTNPETPLSQILYKGTLRRNELEESFGCVMPDNIDFAEKCNIENEETWKKN